MDWTRCRYFNSTRRRIYNQSINIKGSHLFGLDRYQEILRVEIGSTAHGTGLEGHTDRDELSVIIEPPGEVFGIGRQGFKTRMVRTQPEGVRSQPGDLDLTVYSLRTFFELAIAGNPSILAALWAPVLSETQEGVALRNHRRAFIGRHVIPRYRGYMHQQGLRLLGLSGKPRPEIIAEHAYDTKYAMHAARLGLQCIELLTTDHLQLPIASPHVDWLIDVREGNIPFDQWLEQCVILDERMEKLQYDDTIPKGPRTDEIVELSIKLHRTVWKW